MIMKKCPICRDGMLMIKPKKRDKGTKNKPIEIRQLDVRCTSCGDDIRKQINSKKNRHISRDIYAQINGLLTSAEVRKIRKQLKLTQKDAARLCGGGRNAFSRYERGEATPLRSTSNLLRLLSRHPEEIEFLLACCS